MIFSEKFFVGYSDINADYKIIDTSLLKIIENISSMHCTAVGDGIVDSEFRWFLTAHHLKIFSRPKYEERITAVTWNKAKDSLYACRECAIYRENGELAVISLANWARVNLLSGHTVKISDELIAQYGSEPERANFAELRVERLHENAGEISERKFFIDRNYIDANRHMNNVCYLELARLSLPENAYDAEAKEIIINYRRPCNYGESLTCLVSGTKGEYQITQTGENGETKAVIRLISE